MTWMQRYATALGLELSDAEVETILELAREVAHGTERKNAPLAAFLAGRFVGAGGSLDEAVARATDSLHE
jgi:hypothetical protein